VVFYQHKHPHRGKLTLEGLNVRKVNVDEYCLKEDVQRSI